ncbi:MAG TPA: CPBP family intramembrane glutamic endopeptidase, partial [Pirellulales bacterium]|nr:CPBP family intramembrane glutamic endopeptidase [Pirellulales bacterium]
YHPTIHGHSLYAGRMIADRQAAPGARAAQFAVMCLALALPTVATLGYALLLAGHPATKFVYAATKLVQFSLPVVWVALVQRRPIAIRKPNLAGMGISAALGVAVVAGMFGLYYGYLRASPVFAGAHHVIGDQMTDFGIRSLAGFLLLAVFISLIHSLAEEYYWRWFVFGQLQESLPLAVAIAISSLGFMSHHVLVVGKFLAGYGFYTWFFSLCVATGGALWAWLYHRTRSLYGPWLCHFIIDAGLMWIGYDLWTR